MNVQWIIDRVFDKKEKTKSINNIKASNNMKVIIKFINTDKFR